MLGSYELVHTIGILKEGSHQASHVRFTPPWEEESRLLCGIPVTHSVARPLKLGHEVTCEECESQFYHGDWMIIATSSAGTRPIYMGHLGRNAVTLFLSFCRTQPRELSLRLTRNAVTVASRCGSAGTAVRQQDGSNPQLILGFASPSPRSNTTASGSFRPSSTRTRRTTESA